MELHANRLNLPRLMILTGLAFMAGGFLRTLLEWLLSQSSGGENGLLIFLVIWLGFILEAAIGMAAMGYLLRRFYPFRKLWLAGTGAFALGVLIPALLVNQFFYTLLPLPGFLVGLFFGFLLKERAGRESVYLWITLGFFVCQVLVFFAHPDAPWAIWLFDNFGSYSLTFLMHMIENFIIGIFTALGVGLMLRKKMSLE